MFFLLKKLSVIAKKKKQHKNKTLKKWCLITYTSLESHDWICFPSPLSQVAPALPPMGPCVCIWGRNRDGTKCTPLQNGSFQQHWEAEQKHFKGRTIALECILGLTQYFLLFSFGLLPNLDLLFFFNQHILNMFLLL